LEPVALDVGDPVAAGQLLNEWLKSPQTVGDPRLEDGHAWGPLVQEGISLASEVLKVLERLGRDGPGDLLDQCAVQARGLHRGIPVVPAELDDGVDHLSLGAVVLREDSRLGSCAAGAVRRRLLPVQLDELARDAAVGHSVCLAIIAIELHGEIGQRDDQSELVSRRESAFREQALQLRKERELGVR
jgi:hypothetical protein